MKPQKQRAAAGDAPTPPGASVPPASIAQSGRRKRWFRAIAVAIPVLNLLLLELILRVAGFGYPTSFFLPVRANGRPVFIENQEFSRRYFPPGLERTPQPTMFSAVKSPDTVRIFIFGESAAMGDPEPAFGFGRILELMLREAMPGSRIEVINTAVTAINSHVIRRIAEDCVDKQGDYWIVYMGHNEVVGPFGAGTVFGSRTPPRLAIRANLAMKTTRLGQLLDAVRRRFTRQRDTPSTWDGMAMFLKRQVPEDDPRLARVHANFDRNLRDILRLGEGSGARVLVATIPSNLGNCPPFASLHRPGLSPKQQAEWTRLYEMAVQDEDATNYPAAMVGYQQAAEIDARHAGLQFRLGRCQLGLNQTNEARKRFILAQDLDALRFRADSRINELIRRVRSRVPGSHVSLVDAAEIFNRASPNGIPGDPLFYDHVHPTFAGNYLLAQAFAAQIVNTPTSGPALPTAEECARRLAFTDFDCYRVLDEVRQRLQRPPFSDQFDHDRRAANLKRQLERLDRASLAEAFQLYTQAIARTPDDWVLRENFARLLQDFDRVSEATEQWTKVMELVPHSEQSFYHIGRLLDGAGRSAEAVTYLREALRRRPGLIEARLRLGANLLKMGRPDQALRELREALRVDPDNTTAKGLVAQAQAALK